MFDRCNRCGRVAPSAGVTVLELMASLAVMVTLLTIVVPSTADLVADVRRVAVANQLVAVLSLARRESIQRGVRVSMCRSRTVNTPHPGCESDAAWHDGWLLFVDNTHLAGNRLGEIDGVDRVLRVVAPGGGFSLTSGSHYGRGLSYEADGRVWGITSGGSRTAGNDTFTLTAHGKRLCVTVNLTGHASVRQSGQRSC